MMADIVLVQPKAGEFETIGIRPPDSLLTVAAIPVEKGYNVKIVDQRVSKDWRKELKEAMKDALCVGITAMTGQQIKYALEVSKFVKENSNVPVVWGGVHVSLMPEQSIQNKYIDIIVKGEGDYALYEIADALEKQQKSGKDFLKNVRGIYYKKDDQIKKTKERELIQDLDKLPDLPYDLVDMNKYYGFSLEHGKSITLMTSRGCPYRCAFCYNTVYYKNKWRGMSARKTVDKIKYVIDKFGVKSIYFQDDNFCANVGRFKEIIDLILKEKINIKWGLLGSRINSLKMMDEEFLARVVKAGCVNIDVGIESGSQRILNLISKDINLQEVIDVNKKISKFFEKTKYTFIMGLPSETEQELLQSTKFALKLYKDNPHVLPIFNIFFINPGTAVYNMAIKYGYKPPTSLEEWANTGREGEYKTYPWLSKKMIKMMENFELTSFLMTKNIDYKIGKNYLKVLARLYQPFARFRFEHNFPHFFIEKKIYSLFTKK